MPHNKWDDYCQLLASAVVPPIDWWCHEVLQLLLDSTYLNEAMFCVIFSVRQDYWKKFHPTIHICQRLWFRHKCLDGARVKSDISVVITGKGYHFICQPVIDLLVGYCNHLHMHPMAPLQWENARNENKTDISTQSTSMWSTSSPLSTN